VDQTTAVVECLDSASDDMERRRTRERQKPQHDHVTDRDEDLTTSFLQQALMGSDGFIYVLVENEYIVVPVRYIPNSKI
jgi:hypothetical protein